MDKQAFFDKLCKVNQISGEMLQTLTVLNGANINNVRVRMAAIEGIKTLHEEMKILSTDLNTLEAEFYEVNKVHIEKCK